MVVVSLSLASCLRRYCGLITAFSYAEVDSLHFRRQAFGRPPWDPRGGFFRALASARFPSERTHRIARRSLSGPEPHARVFRAGCAQLRWDDTSALVLWTGTFPCTGSKGAPQAR